MGEKEKQILDALSKILPDLTDQQKDWLLAFGEGIAFKTARQEVKETS